MNQTVPAQNNDQSSLGGDPGEVNHIQCMVESHLNEYEAYIKHLSGKIAPLCRQMHMRAVSVREVQMPLPVPRFPASSDDQLELQVELPAGADQRARPEAGPVAVRSSEIHRAVRLQDDDGCRLPAALRRKRPVRSGSKAVPANLRIDADQHL